MSDKITSKDGKYEGVLDVTDGNFVVRRVADGKQISTLGPKPLVRRRPRVRQKSQCRTTNMNVYLRKSTEAVSLITIICLVRHHYRPRRMG